MGRLDGKVTLITGGARGQGAEEARLFASEGATVIITDVLDEEGRACAADIPRTTYLHLDVRSEAAWEEIVAGVIRTHGRVDVLVNNAGIDLAKRFELTTLDDWERVVAVNQTGVFLGMRTVGRAMISAGTGGSIINVSSVAGMEGVRGRAAYGSTKWAVRGITKVGALEWGEHGIRVNSIHPGFIETPMTADLKAFKDPETRVRAEKVVSLRRMGQPLDIAWMALFLASDESSYCTGQEFVVDGGVHH
ncbi:MAG: SDR family oxidoreductase [Gammaproteobacteria bacterium]|nr:SDR family oxidoreductase [Gammaproteobacteria bacterium]